MVGLLDVNVIIALVVETHIFHEVALGWLVDDASRDGWATCPLVELGAIRILMNPRIAEQWGIMPMPPRRTARAIIGLRRAVPGYNWWADDVPAAARYEVRAAATPKQVTDRYIVGLARKHGGRVVTTDAPLANSAGESALNLLRGLSDQPSL